MVEGKNRVRVDFIDGYGHPKSQVFPNTVKAEAAEGLFYLYIEDDGEVLVAIGVPLQRLIRFAALKNEEVSSDASQTGESPEDSQVCDSPDA